MAKPRSGAKKATPAAKKVKSTKPGVLKTASKSVAKAAAKLVTKTAGSAKQQEKKAPAEKKAAPAAEKKAAPAAAAKKTAAKAATKVKEVATAATKIVAKAATKVKEAAAPKGKESSSKGREAAVAPPAAEKPRPRATKLPPMAEPLNKRDLEQLLTAGAGRGVVGEGSLKGRLTVIDGLPNLVVVGRDKRELTFILQGPDQEVLPAYMDHKVSVSGLIKKTTNYGGTVDVRKFSAKKPEVEEPTPEPVETEVRLRYLSPGEVSQVISAGMGAGMKGFAALRGNLEMTGDEFVLVVSNGGTRQQVSYILEGKGAKGLRKFLGHTLSVTGVVDKSLWWGGRMLFDNVYTLISYMSPF